MERLRGSSGFTLIEVIFAVMILAGSLIILLGLQTSVVQKALRDRNQQAAMLVGRSILATIEADPDLVDNQDTTEPAYKLLQKLGGVDQNDKEEAERLEGITANLQVTDFQMPLPIANPVFNDPLQLRQVILTLSWGDTPDDVLEIIYFVPEG